MAISKKALLAKPRLVTKEVEVEGFDEPFRFRELTTAQRLEFADATGAAEGEEKGLRDNVESSLRFVVQSLVDDKDVPLFTDDFQEGIDVLLEHPMKRVEALIAACLEVNGMGKDSLKEEVGNSAGEGT